MKRNYGWLVLAVWIMLVSCVPLPDPVEIRDPVVLPMDFYAQVYVTPVEITDLPADWSQAWMVIDITAGKVQNMSSPTEVSVSGGKIQLSDDDWVYRYYKNSYLLMGELNVSGPVLIRVYKDQATYMSGGAFIEFDTSISDIWFPEGE